MKSFIRVLYGETLGHGYPNHRSKILGEVNNIIKNPNKVDFITYVMGEENYRILTDLGLKCVLIRKNSPLGRSALLQKIEALNCAMQDFDEVILMDWDCVPTMTVEEVFWENFKNKEDLQCPLYKCPRNVVLWRKGRRVQKYLSGGFYVYCRSKAISSTLYGWSKNKGLPNNWSDEIYYSRYIDDLLGFGETWEKVVGFVEYQKMYFERFEPSGCIHISSCFKERHINEPFAHPRKGKYFS